MFVLYRRMFVSMSHLYITIKWVTVFVKGTQPARGITRTMGHVPSLLCWPIDRGDTLGQRAADSIVSGGSGGRVHHRGGTAELAECFSAGGVLPTLPQCGYSAEIRIGVSRTSGHSGGARTLLLGRRRPPYSSYFTSHRCVVYSPTKKGWRVG